MQHKLKSWAINGHGVLAVLGYFKVKARNRWLGAKSVPILFESSSSLPVHTSPIAANNLLGSGDDQYCTTSLYVASVLGWEGK